MSGWGRRPYDGEVFTSGLFDRRIVTLQGPLDDQRAGQVCAELMMLDACGDDPVELYVDSAGGTLEAAFSVMDTIDLLGVAVEATCLGRADGPAVGVVAVGHHRRAARHARFRLTAPLTSASGTATQLESWASHQQRQLDSFIARLAEATHRPVEHLEADLDAGRYLGAEEAVAYGLVDEIWQPERPRPRRPSLPAPPPPESRPSGPIPPLRPPLGFRPPER